MEKNILILIWEIINKYFKTNIILSSISQKIRILLASLVHASLLYSFE
jgi:hypothetical protein